MIKSRILEMREGKYIKTFTKIQVRGVFHMRDFRRNVFIPKVIELCAETPCWCPYEEQSTSVAQALYCVSDKVKLCYSLTSNFLCLFVHNYN